MIPFFCVAWVGHTDPSREMAEDIRRALDAIGMKHETAALQMGLTLPMFSRQLAGIEPLNLYRLGYLPVEFTGAWLTLRCQRIGGEYLSPKQVAFMKAAAQLGIKRMARCLPHFLAERKVS